mmetsp:Transcript_6950/g.12381  ORF Transcript_6950/g.12381 Transcript_6950/m.12381 type:complete len:296 (+) Transcript_6950:79-966(+)
MSWDAVVAQDLVPLLVPQEYGASFVAMSVMHMLAYQWHAPFVLLCALNFFARGVGAASSDADQSAEVCSAALGFNSSSGPKDRSKQDLQFCTEHHKRTCCERNHTRQVLGWYGLFSTERSEKCTRLSRLVGCGLCDGDVGVGLKSDANLVLLCPSLCERWFRACAEDFFASMGSGSSLVPCTSSSLVCSPLNEITEDARTFCESAGSFRVLPDDEDDADRCFDGVPAAKTRGTGPRAPYTPPQPDEEPWWQKTDRDIKRFLRSLSLRASSLEGYLPAFIVGTVGVLIAWYVMRES